MHCERIRTCIETEFEIRGRRASGRIKNVSESGAFIDTQSVPDEGENVDLIFKAPGGKEVRLSGLVWWTTGGNPHRAPGFGMRLLYDNEDYQRFLASLQ